MAIDLCVDESGQKVDGLSLDLKRKNRKEQMKRGKQKR